MCIRDSVYTEGALHYTIADESITITGYFGKDAAVTVPASIAGIPVNTIAKGAFTDNDNVKTVDLPDVYKRQPPSRRWTARLPASRLPALVSPRTRTAPSRLLTV